MEGGRPQDRLLPTWPHLQHPIQTSCLLSISLLQLRPWAARTVPRAFPCCRASVAAHRLTAPRLVHDDRLWLLPAPGTAQDAQMPPHGGQSAMSAPGMTQRKVDRMPMPTQALRRMVLILRPWVYQATRRWLCMEAGLACFLGMQHLLLLKRTQQHMLAALATRQAHLDPRRGGHCCALARCMPSRIRWERMGMQRLRPQLQRTCLTCQACTTQLPMVMAWTQARLVTMGQSSMGVVQVVAVGMVLRNEFSGRWHTLGIIYMYVYI
mmetsp:Transcript_17512/g.52649  ORF Transcript_17512/g.52649 Transcript_17512/m.52649 type:complete len:266 (+) Transcript_17512:1230-2027(+)